jgi:hypothetical protein
MALASFRCAVKIGRYWVHSGHWPGLVLNSSVANDPKQTFRARAGYTGVRRQQRRAAQASAEPEFSPPELPYRIGSLALPRIRSP